MVERGPKVPPRDMFPVPGDNIELAKPTIAAVNGVAFAGGWMICPGLRPVRREHEREVRHHRGQGGPGLAVGGAADSHDPAADHDGDRPDR